ECAELADVALVDEGLRTVKDFEEPARLHRLVVPGAADDHRPIRTMDVPTNLPGEVTPLVGRDAEIEALQATLAASRIITLTGPGGSGKTRLALGVAHVARDRFPHGVWFVDLAAVRDPGLLESTVAATLGLRESPSQTLGDALRTHLRERTTLLVLDNLEQLLPEAARIVAALLREAPGIRVVVTSRELLRIAGEHGYSVPPLDLDAGVALFVGRARAIRPDLVIDDDAHAAIRAICERLGGLPLAIELAAARIRLLSPALILERLGRSLDLGGGARDLPERQRTLRGAIAWSHELLAEAERRLFARLAVFAGGWTVETALAVADPDGDLGMDVIGGLESLADKSLIRIEAADAAADSETRFSMHPLLRDYAVECLAASGERVVIESRFAMVCVSIAEASGGRILGPEGEVILRRLDREGHNLRAAIDWAMAGDAPDIGLRIVAPVWRWFQQRGRLREARALLTDLLARPTDVDARVRIIGLAAEGGLAYWMNDFPAARAAYEERLAMAEAAGDPVLAADANYDLGFLFTITNETELLRRHEQRALDLYSAAGREDGAIRARQALVVAHFLAGGYETARDLQDQNLVIFRRTGSQFQIADSMTLLAAVNWRLGDPALAWQRMVEGLRFFAGLDSEAGLVQGLGMAAIILISDGDAELGARVTGATYRLINEKALMLAPVMVLHLPDPADLAAGHFGPERAAEIMAVGAESPISDIVAEVLAARLPARLPAPVSAD
ncbi:MAG: Adenylate/guanylate cyclase protein, partial [Chloroflexi bacterium]|nr:Adenylate/guanylate cyclase protein [Chloroflexota bacterium]